jgi:dTDP-4-amino-4,6-dideoxygalactose transaminase
MDTIPFNVPCVLGTEKKYIDEVLARKELCGNGYFTNKCQAFMEEKFNARHVLLTTSCTSALEMCSLLLNLQPGDEVLVPSYTFVSTVNAIIMRGATPVFVDIRPDTLNMDETRIEAAITSQTKAIYVVHYAAVGAAMDKILAIADKHGIFVVEDAAQGVDATYRGRYLGTIGHLGAFSFHDTKNYNCGEGGALIVNDARFIERAEVILEKGTNRKQFFDGYIDKYTWVDIGSSFILSELNAAYLYAQLEAKDAIRHKRLSVYNRYQSGLQELAHRGIIFPTIPLECEHNGHMFYLLCRSRQERTRLLSFLKSQGVFAVFHYVPLHTAPMGQKIAAPVTLPVTEDLSARLVRLPMYYDLTDAQVQRVIDMVNAFYSDMDVQPVA